MLDSDAGTSQRGRHAPASHCSPHGDTCSGWALRITLTSSPCSEAASHPAPSNRIYPGGASRTGIAKDAPLCQLSFVSKAVEWQQCDTVSVSVLHIHTASLIVSLCQSQCYIHTLHHSLCLCVSSCVTYTHCGTNDGYQRNVLWHTQGLKPCCIWNCVASDWTCWLTGGI